MNIAISCAEIEVADGAPLLLRPEKFVELSVKTACFDTFWGSHVVPFFVFTSEAVSCGYSKSFSEASKDSPATSVPDAGTSGSEVGG